MLVLIFSLVLHVASGGSVNAALDSARAVYASRGEKTTILIEPGTYQEELTIDVPGLKMKNASRRPSTGLRNNGVDCDDQAVRITWYYGHGYQYRSMGGKVNYGGSRTRLWNASVLVTAPDFYAENIIFENSFNLYVSEKEAQDSLVTIRQPGGGRQLPERPKTAGSTEVQLKRYRERAAALSFAGTATNAHLKNCRAVGRQDVVYGAQGASVYWEGGILQGAVDFVFGAMRLCVDRATVIANINGEKGDKCYISAGRSGSNDKGEQVTSSRGMLFYKCHIRPATEEELLPIADSQQQTAKVWLARPWRWWGETVWAYTTWERGVLNEEGWHVGLVKDKPGYRPANLCPYSYEYRSQDRSQGRPEWVHVLRRPYLPDGTRISPKNWK